MMNKWKQYYLKKQIVEKIDIKKEASIKFTDLMKDLSKNFIK